MDVQNRERSENENCWLFDDACDPQTVVRLLVRVRQTSIVGL